MTDSVNSIHTREFLRAFHAQNSGFDLLTADLHPAHLDQFNWDGFDRELAVAELQLQQRLLRLGHGETVARKLRHAGFDSAHQIALVPEHVFVRNHTRLFGGDADKARAVHRSAAQIKARVKHVWANVKDLVASAHYRGTLFQNVSPQLIDYFQSIPSYDDLFGGKDFCTCEHCRSIFGPAAYFLDIMRITDQYITDPNTTKPANNIPPAMKLEDRRPDLFKLKLDCANTNDLRSYLQIVNHILATRVEIDLAVDNAFKPLAIAPYPFNLPFHLPLNQIRIHLGQLKVSLFSIFQTFLIAQQDWHALQNTDAAREYISISPEQYRFATTPLNDPVALAAAYGYSSINDDVPINDLARLSEFLYRTSLTRTQVVSLLRQDLDDEELDKNLADNFFINNTGEDLPYIRLTVDKSDPKNPYEKLEHLSSSRLDRLNRFIRLAGWLGWSYADLDWAMVSTGATEIDETFMIRVAQIKYLQDTLQLPIDLLSSFWHDMKNIGKVSAANPRDAFDRVFNNPALLDGQNPYDPNNPPVFDPSRPLDWQIDDRTGQNGTIRSRLQGALVVNDNDLTLVAKYVSVLNDTAGSVRLTLSNLTMLYRLTKLAAVNRLTMDAFLRLVSLIALPAAAAPSSPDAVLSLQEQAGWLRNSPLNVYEAEYIITGVRNEFVNPGYKTSGVKPFIESLSVSSEASRVAAAQLVFEDIDDSEAAVIFRQLRAHEFINDFGVQFNKDLTYASILSIRTVTPLSLVTDDIDQTAAQAAVTLLQQREIVDAEGFLSATFGPQTDLGFLFSGDPESGIKQGEVRSTLLAIQALPFTVRPASFVSDEISLATATQAFNELQKSEHDVIDQHGGLNPDFNAQTSLSYLFPGEEKAEFMRGEIKSVLLQVKRDLVHTIEIMRAQRLLQEDNVRSGLGQFLGTTPEMMGVLLRFTAPLVQMNDYLVDLLSPVTQDPLPERVFKLMAGLSREITLASRLGFTPDEAQFVIDHPAHFDISELLRPTFNDLRTLANFKVLVKDFRDTDNSLLNYFKLPKTTNCPDQKIEALAALTGWNVAQICTLINSFWPSGIAGAKDYDTVAGVMRLKACFDLCSQTGTDVASLMQLADLHGLFIVDTNGIFVEANWQTYVNAARSTLDVLNAKYDDADFAEIFTSIESLTETRKRDALVGFTIWLLSKHSDLDFIKSPSDLYQYLLIDVEMSGCAVTTAIAQAIASVQLYMQRSRMSLEPGVTDLEIPQEWWPWMISYRVWEANRKIFLYPENYIEPSLRRDQTPPFRQLSESLLQTDINEQAVAKAYTDYFEQFAVLANLIVCGSYSHTELDRARDQEVETLYIFGRTNTEPYSYYYRTLTHGDTWSAWQPVDLPIASRFVTPVYAFGKLFIFWSELSQTGGSTLKNGSDSESQSLVNTTIKYSFRNLTNQWSPPQTLAANIPVKVAPDQYLQQQENVIKELFETKDLSWQQPYALRISRGFRGSGRITIEGEKRCIGTNTRFQDEVKIGDQIWCADDVQTVKAIKSSLLLEFERHWNVFTKEAEYKIIPHDPDRDSFLPFAATGDIETTAGKYFAAGTNTRFDKEISVGDRIRCGNEMRLVTKIEGPEFLWVDYAWKAAYKGKFTVFSGADGEERLLIAYGNAITAHTGATPALPVLQTSNDNFTAQLNAFNESLYNSLNIESTMYSLGSRRDITFGPAGLLNADLIYSQAPFVIADYKQAALDPPRPYRPMVDRPSKILRIEQSDSTLADNYWGNSAPGTKQIIRPSTGAFVDLLFNISAGTALLANVINKPGQFVYYNGDETFLVRTSGQPTGQISDMAMVQPAFCKFERNAGPEFTKAFFLTCGAYTEASLTPFTQLKFAFTRISTVTVQPLSQRLFAGGIKRLLTIDSQQLAELPFTRFYLDPQLKPFAVIPPHTDRLDFNGAYGDYFWEIFFHAPFLVAEGLRTRRRFEEARQWYQFIFDPTARPDASDTVTNDRYWRFLPFRSLTPESLRDILTNPRQIREYNDDPFNPDAIARLRPTAYAKAIVMRYIDNLLDWGDFLFTQDTQEAITQATNLYVMAADLLGKRPEAVGVCRTPRARNFAEIKQEYSGVLTSGVADGAGEDYIQLALNASPEDDFYVGMRIRITGGTGAGQQRIIDSYDGTSKIARLETRWATQPAPGSAYEVLNDIPQFLIQLENTPFAAEAGTAHFRDIPFNDINSYFCVPENEEFIRYWDRVEDRLFKIRHCMNIQGVERPLAPFAPPINPRELVRAAASGAAGFQLAAQIEPPVPNYRFNFVLAAARSLTNTLTQLGSSLLSAYEKQDSEELAMIQKSQETVLLNLTTSIKENQIVDIEQTRQSLVEGQSSAKARSDFYGKLLLEGLSSGELQNLKELEKAMIFNIVGGALGMAASIAYAVPNFGSPFAMTYGGQQLGSALNATSSAFELSSYISSYRADRSLTMAGYGRRIQDWSLQLSLAGYDFKQIGSQISAADAQKKMADQDLTTHLRNLEQSREVEQFLKSKFTNKELYQWMVGRLNALYFQTYTLAFELARSAQRAYQYELNTSQTFINFGYWDGIRAGLLAGEGLLLELNRMEKAYIDGHNRSLEIERNVSLMQLDPKALLDLQNSGECTFELSERLFDYDFPGHYCRKLKSITVSVPAVVGPYQNIKATLTQLSNHVVQRPDVSAVNFLLSGDNSTLPGPEILRSNWRINQRIALSRGVDDSGMFQVNFDDDRYLPFEGTGAVSTWRLSIPRQTNRINFSAISDVIVTLNYTAHDGGAFFRQQVTSLPALKPFAGSKLFIMNQQYSQQWFTFLHDHSNTAGQTLRFEIPENLIPPHLQQAKLTGFYFVLDVPAGHKTEGVEKYLTFSYAENQSLDFNLDEANGYSQMFEPPVEMSQVVGPRSIGFKLDDAGKFTPPDLKKDGFLNPAVIKNVLLVLYYEAEVDWS